ncbi:MAG: hypothetical protein FWG10_01460 [Eubacteriaceae bacterium]|nr:hypothetical protein [Eubacteriaceae bacterium]
MENVYGEIRTRAGQGYFKLAYRKLADNYELQGECGIDEEIEYCVDLIQLWKK